MSLKFTGELCVMTMKNDVKFEELCLMALNIGSKFEGKLTCASRNDMMNLANFHQSMFESL